jgi:hypothetical protein
MDGRAAGGAGAALVRRRYRRTGIRGPETLPPAGLPHAERERRPEGHRRTKRVQIMRLSRWLLLSALCAGSAYGADAPPALYIRGAFNGWGTDNQLADKGKGLYEAQILISPGYHPFKVGSKDWSAEWVIDPAASMAVAPGTDYRMSTKPGPQDYLFVKTDGFVQVQPRHLGPGRAGAARDALRGGREQRLRSAPLPSARRHARLQDLGRQDGECALFHLRRGRAAAHLRPFDHHAPCATPVRRRSPTRSRRTCPLSAAGTWPSTRFSRWPSPR